MALVDFFLDSVLHGLLLVCLALSLGGLGWGLWGLRPWQGRAPRAVVDRCLALLGRGALLLALCQAAILCLKTWTLSRSLGFAMMGDLLVTAYFVAGAARTLLALGVAAAVWRLARDPARVGRWAALTVAAAFLAASGAWMTHASGRLEGRGVLMALSVVHQLGAAVWIGGLIQLAAIWPLARRDPAVEAAWPHLVRRFSKLAMASVLALILGAAPLAWIYIGSLGNLIGTVYGSLVLIKSMLFGAALLLAALSFAAVHGRAGSSSASPPRARVPYLAEGEAIVAVMILFTAAALSDQPPSADLRAADRATVAEVALVFSPKLPSLKTPSLEAMRLERERPEGGERSREAYLWSNFSHNGAGLILLVMAVVALAGSLRQAAWERYWPLGFVAMAAFVYLRAAANDGVWPFGTVSLLALDAEALQHFLAAFLVLALGLFEWRARSPGLRRHLVRCLFPALAMAGGVLLLMHSHTAFETKPSFLVQVTHSAIGALAGLMAAARWLELRLDPASGRVAGAVAAGAMLAIALVLVFYREANVAIPG